MRQIEVLVVGAGPAGATAALNLASTRDVVLLERHPHTTHRIGESLPPVINRLLSDMGHLESFRKQGHVPCYGNRSIWGSTQPTELDFLRDPDGHGWHIDRQLFESGLRLLAIERGANLISPAYVKSVAWDRRRRRWHLLIEHGGRTEAAMARFVIDAGGRSAPLARSLGARRRVLDRLICGWVYGNAKASGRSAGLTYIQAEEEGWWYTALLPGSRRVLAFHTDADLPAAAIAKDRKMLLHRAGMQKELAAVLAESSFMADAHLDFTAAHTGVLAPCAGPGWAAIGDAALSFDPLSSQGLLNAMFTALAAAEATDRQLDGDSDSFDEYIQTINGIFQAYLAHLKFWYQAERRWMNTPFWQRRHEYRIRQ